MKLVRAIWKEWLLLIRDPGGLAILFAMPVSLVVLMTMIQDMAFRVNEENSAELLVVDYDQSVYSTDLLKTLAAGEKGFLQVIDSLDGAPLDSATVNRLINTGKYQAGLLIPKGFAERTERIVEGRAAMFLSDLTGTEAESIADSISENPRINLFFDPATNQLYRNGVEAAIAQELRQKEGSLVLEELSNQLAELTGMEKDLESPISSFIEVNEQTTQGKPDAMVVAKNSSQHNVPAWTVFAIFFIVLPLASNVLREKELGILVRVNVLGDNMATSYIGKIIAYSGIGILQTILIIGFGVYLFPLIGLPKIDIGSGLALIIYIAIATSFCATSYGLLVGSVFNTVHQAAVFGVVSVVIMAAIGGIWVPLYVMSDTMVSVGKLSPMNWAMECFNSILLRNVTSLEVILKSVNLWLFGGLCFLTSILLDHFFKRR